MEQDFSPEGQSWLFGVLFPDSKPSNIPSKNVDQNHAVKDNAAEEPESSKAPIRTLEPFKLLVRPDLKRNVRRRLKGLHLFMITINATLGVGLYSHSGQLLRVGGPLGLLLSFLICGVLAWGMMQSITELLCIWPIPGALDLYVSEFVEPELGIAVGIAYWYTYSVSFAALISSVASTIQFFGPISDAVEGGVIFFLLVLVLVLITGLKIEIYGFNEILGGTLKSIFFVVICATLVAIKCGAHAKDAQILPVKIDPQAFDSDIAHNWLEALLMSISSAAFSYIGVEVIAASALEARWPRPIKNVEAPNDQRVPLIGQTIQQAAVWVPVLAMIAYFIGGLLVCLIIPWNDPALPRFSWSQSIVAAENSSQTQLNQSRVAAPNSTSAFVTIARYSEIPKLAIVFNVFIVFTGITCANTNLYVSSRSLFAMTSRLQSGGSEQPFLIRGLAWLGKTNRYKVPMRCIIASTLSFCWVPYLTLVKGVKGGKKLTIKPIDAFVDILSHMSSDGVIIVWACECIAFVRFYYSMEKHQEYFRANNVAQVQRFNFDNDDYPFRSIGQPFTAYAVSIFCVMILVVFNGASMWKTFNVEPLLSSYLTLICFVVLWLGLKMIRGAGIMPQLVDLSKPEAVHGIINRFNQMRFRGADDEADAPNIWNFWGFI